MNILFLLRLYPVYGGGETVTLCLANEMVKRGWNVSILYFKENTRKQFPFIDPRIKAIKIEGVNYGEFSTEKAHKLKNEREIVHTYAVQYIRDNKIDIVMNQWWPLCFIDRLKKETDSKIIKVHHTAFYIPILDGNGIKAKIKRNLRPLYEKYKRRQVVKAVIDTLPYVDKYVFLSPSFQKQFIEFSHYTDNASKLDSIPNPLVFDQYITPDKYAKKEHIVLIVGRMFESDKKITRALRAWRMVEESPVSSGWKLQIVGEGPDLSGYKQLAKALNLQRVSFEGYQQPLPYYEKAQIFLMTSAVEGFGMTLIESQQQGVVPIVMDTFLSLHDIITSGENGIITPDGDETLFAQAILSLMENPKKLDALAQQALVTCRKFSINNIVDLWENLITKMRTTNN
ncbi:glycosyltransferase [Phocaeicola coprophilus]|uniref:glycosyltransferase n=1 Tax=Phocaeicola coprophilus TaxID=387090 RepID=UPI00294293BD|nr:glycosyltransferase [Phocaeicola coprophilus]